MARNNAEYKREFEEIIYPFLVDKYSMSSEEYQKQLTKVTELVFNRFKRRIYKEAGVRVAKIYNVDKVDFVDSCIGACGVAILLALKRSYPVAIGQFTVYICKVITATVIQELTVQFQQVQPIEGISVDLLPSTSLCSCGEAGGSKFDLYLEFGSRLKMLSEDEQKLLHDHFILDKSFRDMQEEYGITFQAISLRYINIIKKLKAMFTAEEIEELRQSYMEDD